MGRKNYLQHIAFLDHSVANILISSFCNLFFNSVEQIYVFSFILLSFSLTSYRCWMCCDDNDLYSISWFDILHTINDGSNDRDSRPKRYRELFCCQYVFVVADLTQSVYQLATGWTARDSNPSGGEFFQLHPDRPKTHPASCKTGTLSLSRGQSGRDVV